MSNTKTMWAIKGWSKTLKHEIVAILTGSIFNNNPSRATARRIAAETKARTKKDTSVIKVVFDPKAKNPSWSVYATDFNGITVTGLRSREEARTYRKLLLKDNPWADVFITKTAYKEVK